ncbi:MAG TPA: serine/threonine-protein kinase [Polyangiaceae bacterium]|nr:serine/threonine-protein kinase [Polyangiaceae bacterium]
MRDAAGAERCPGCSGLWVVAGRYELGSVLGRGGTATVFAGHDRQSGEAIAIKVLTVSDHRDWKALELFERGTAILRGLAHPGFPRIHAFVKDGLRAYQVRQYYGAGSLEQLVHGGLRLDRRRVHFLLKALLELLDHLHTRTPAVLHRDVKPANIVFASKSPLQPVLVDFDAAAAHGPAGSGTTIVVSPGYSAPEQLAGDGQPASDLYSLGMTMLFVLTGRAPLELPRKDGKPDLCGVLAGLEPATRLVIERLCAIDLDTRYRSARDALRELAGLLAPVKAQTEPSAWLLKLEAGGASLFRIAVGVLLGLVVIWLVFSVRALNGTAGDTTQRRGMGSHR